MKIGLIFGGIVIAVFGALVFAGMLSHFPPPADILYAKDTGPSDNPVRVNGLDQTITWAPFTVTKTGELTGLSILIRSTNPSTMTCTFNVEIRNSAKTAIVALTGDVAFSFPALGGAWFTLGFHDLYWGKSLVTSGVTYNLRLTVFQGEGHSCDASKVFWFRSSSDGKFFLRIYGFPEPPAAPSNPVQTPGPGGSDAPDTETDCTTNPTASKCQASHSSISAREILGILLILIGALIAIAGIFV